MLTLIRGAQCFSPEPLGDQDVLIGGNRILRIAPHIEATATGVVVDEVDARDHWLVPGLVDSLVHITGGGGEGGFASRTPELQLSSAVQAGITTMVGALGTDSLTRNLANLLAKARELQAGGIYCVCHTGSYHLPVKTLTGSVEHDIVFIPEFIGVGEVAISDHRSSQPSEQALASLAAEARVAGMIAGKAGIVSVHVGDGAQCLEPLWQVSRNTDLPLHQFDPTHINRNPDLFSAGIAFAKAGGVIDLTTSTTPELIADGEVTCGEGLRRCLQAKVPASRITFSSDGNASLPRFNEAGELIGLQVGDPGSLWKAVTSAIQEYEVPVPVALAAATSNPAQVLKLEGRGRLREGGPADLLLIHTESLQIDSVMSAGAWRQRNGELLARGCFE